MSTNWLVKSYELLNDFKKKKKKKGRSNKFENTLIDEKAINDFILLRTEWLFLLFTPLIDFLETIFIY